MVVRLMLAGFHQIVSPAFTAETIFKITDPDARKTVMELGFRNVSIALLALLLLDRTDRITPAAIVGAVFYCLAALQHARNRERTGTETVAVASDPIITGVEAFYPIAL